MAVDMHDCPPYLKGYISYLRVIKNRSEKTIESYYIDLRQFLRYLKTETAGASQGEIIADLPFSVIEKVTFSDIMEYLDYSAGELKNNEKTRARKISALKGFFKALSGNKVMNYHLEDNPMLNIEMPTLKKTQPKYLSLDDSRRLLETVNPEDGFYERDFCILMLFLNCGMRLSELVGININDIDMEDRSLRLLGKGNKERSVHINEGCADAIKQYLAVRPEADTDALFLSRRKTRISNRRVQQIVTGAIEHIGMGNRGLSTHKLRHTAATLMYQYGNVDPMVLKEILGHASVSTTEIYTHLTNENVRTAIESNPLADEVSRKRRRKTGKDE